MRASAPVKWFYGGSAIEIPGFLKLWSSLAGSRPASESSTSISTAN